MALFDSLGRWLWKRQGSHRQWYRPLFKRLSRRADADYPFQADFFGLRYDGNLNNNIDYAVYYFGAFEKPVLFFLRDTLTSLVPEGDRCFIDIGANVGQHTLFMSNHACRVHAFEPYPPVRDVLVSRVLNNNIENVSIHPVGLSDANASLPFYAPTGRNKGIGSFDQSSVAKGNQPIGELQLVKGDDFLETLELEKIHLIKMDVEGFEKPALRGLSQTLAKHRPVVVFELTYDGELSFKSMEDVLETLPADYELYAFVSRDANGRRARSRNARARVTGEYQLAPVTEWRSTGQDDLVAVPAESREALAGVVNRKSI